MRRSTDVVKDAVRQLASTPAGGFNGVARSVCRRVRAALALLLEAYDFARDSQRDTWDFAVEIESLRNVGLTNSVFRWLVCKGLVEHAREVPSSDDQSRAFRRGGKLCFGRRTAFVLTEAGARFARNAVGPSSPLDLAVETEPAGESGRSADSTRPKWDRDRQELRVGGAVVKQYKVPAANQQRILAAFEEEGWPAHIDDPLPPVPDQDPKRRLHDTINSLNRNQKRSLIRFLGDGSGQGVRWTLVPPSENGNGSSVSGR